MSSDLRSDRGLATVFGLAIIFGLVSLLMMMSAAVSWLLAHSHAASVADLAALAAATQGSCAAADRAAQVNGSQLLDCQWEGSDVIVTIRSELRHTFAVVPVNSVHASARAGF